MATTMDHQATDIYDIAIIGGGINGCGIAADAAARGLKVYLCEQDDLASGTSSASSKLIHGGLRYLEHYEFRLVKEALAEREVLLANAPHLVSPLKFTLPHRPHLRPAWMIRAGLFLYDHLSTRNSLPSAKTVKLGSERGMLAGIAKGFEYYDCWVDDARLVISNAIEARRHQANIQTRRRCVAAQYNQTEHYWSITLENSLSGERSIIQAKHVINAAGPWLNALIESSVPQINAARNIRLIKGSHIIVPRVPFGDNAYILQNEDKRIVFVLPYKDKYSIIGTTDKEYTGDLNAIQIDQDEKTYLLNIYNQHFQKQISEQDIVATYSGVRPLCDDESNDPSAITRDYTIEDQTVDGSAFISIYGGKITTYRKLANAVLDTLQPYLNQEVASTQTAKTPLPGCKFVGQTREEIKSHFEAHYPWLGSHTIERFCASYGHLADSFIEGLNKLEDLGEDFGLGLSQKEVDYLVDQEWAVTDEDILMRRTKLGYEYSEAQRAHLRRYLASKKTTEQPPRLTAV